MPKMKKDEIIPIIKQAIIRKVSMDFGGMWFFSQSMKRLKKRITPQQEMRTLHTLFFDKHYIIVLLDGLNDSYIWAVWKVNEEKIPITVHGQLMHNTKYDSKWMGFYEHPIKGGCEILGHHPMPKLGFNGRASFSVCKYCNKSIENSGEGEGWVESPFR